MMQSLISLMLMLAATLSQPAAASFSPPPRCIRLLSGGDYRLSKVVPLSDALAEQPTMAHGNGVFQLDSVFILVKEGQRILLSGSEMGGGFVTDDLLLVATIPANKQQSWDFRSVDHMAIIPVSQPQDITHLFVPGHNMVTLTMRDMLGPVYSTSAYRLLILDPCGDSAPKAAPTTASTQTPSVTPAAAWSPIATALPPSPAAIMTPAAERPAVQHAENPPGASPITATIPQVTATETNTPPVAEDDASPFRPIALLPLGIGLIAYWWIVMGKPALKRRRNRIR
ncbi:MAG: hypothetical protein R2867_02760 [Caldilineaceae bacterium]